jgi:hypothetical protein
MIKRRKRQSFPAVFTAKQKAGRQIRPKGSPDIMILASDRKAEGRTPPWQQIWAPFEKIRS